MAASVTVLWLVAAFLGGAFSLSCFHCNTINGDNCEGSEKPCLLSQDTCITTLTEIHQDKQKMPAKYLVKACGEKKFCGQGYTMSFNTTKLYASTTCCESDKCKTNMPSVEELKKDKDKENTLSCPHCIEFATTKCSDGESAKCYGKEDKCVNFTTKEVANSSKVSKWKGCATANLCSRKNLVTLPMNFVSMTDIQCNRGPSLLPGLLLPVAFGPAMLKLLL